MTDDLIKRVAKKLGLVELKRYSPGDPLFGVWKNLDGELERPSVWLASIDAALDVIKPSNKFELWKDDTGWNCSDHGGFSHGQPTECHAILEAFLVAAE